MRKSLSRLRTQDAQARSCFVRAAALTSGLAVALPAQFIPESTHDHTTTAGAPADLREGAVDVKTPGNGRTYSVATIDVEVTITDPVTLIPATYSNVVVGNPPQGGLSFNNGDRKQVVLLQCVDAAGAIQWQRYFFGVTPLLPKESRRPTNARAVSVWAAATEEDTRIAICGET